MLALWGLLLLFSNAQAQDKTQENKQKKTTDFIYVDIPKEFILPTDSAGRAFYDSLAKSAIAKKDTFGLDTQDSLFADKKEKTERDKKPKQDLQEQTDKEIAQTDESLKEKNAQKQQEKSPNTKQPDNQTKPNTEAIAQKQNPDSETEGEDALLNPLSMIATAAQQGEGGEDDPEGEMEEDTNQNPTILRIDGKGKGGNQTNLNLKLAQGKTQKIAKDTTIVQLFYLDGVGAVWLPDSLLSDVRMAKSFLREDTTNYDNFEFENIVMVSEELAIDCVWVTLNQYYAIWSSEIINPYKSDATTFKDTISLQLYDPALAHLWAMPLDTSQVNSKFGWRGRRWHHGIDLELDTGDPVYAVFDGIVRIERYNSGYGNHVVLRHYNGLETLYAHLSQTDVEVGTFVKAGQQLGLGGSTGRSTGPHLHFEVRYEGHTIDPSLVFDFPNHTIAAQTFHIVPKYFAHLGNRHHRTQNIRQSYTQTGKAQDSRQVIYHTVRYGDSYWKISRMYGTSMDAICKLNGITLKTPLRVGKKLRVR
ncbi:M23 family metallopeptidase [Hugenholtzia roseola]|uniref:M23 family metallopeptidase n=1 Tax=Hugenholtzia roseola TaxID=1002 RepID=UPI00040C6EAB|nr:M23 family metallopeptidase [Hugenholtzia roseola]